MYAITATSFRAIADASDVQAGEVVVNAIPTSLLATPEAAVQRRQRDAMLAACDWTQGADSPLGATTKAAWASYRTALRNVPQQSEFPATINWPMTP